MVSKFKTIALAGALMMAVTPAFAEDLLAPLGKVDLDPFHIFTPAPAPAAKPMMKHHMMKHHMMKKHHMMMHKKMMMKKPMMKKPMMKKPMMKKKMMKKM